MITLDGNEAQVLVEQSTVVDPRRLGRSAGRLDADKLRAVDDALCLGPRSLTARMTEPAEERLHISPYDPDWPAQFNRERDLLWRAIGTWIVGDIHHVGSTAVPGLDAKPIIDLLVGVEDLAISRACFEPLAELEYLYAPYLPEEMHWFCKPDPSRRTHHLHLVPRNLPRYRDELAFRDCLRSEPEKARDYAELKHQLAARFEYDREGYTNAKADFIERTLREGETNADPGARSDAIVMQRCTRTQP